MRSSFIVPRLDAHMLRPQKFNDSKRFGSPPLAMVARTHEGPAMR
jgi:hypothetical protein